MKLHIEQIKKIRSAIEWLPAPDGVTSGAVDEDNWFWDSSSSLVLTDETGIIGSFVIEEDWWVFYPEPREPSEEVLKGRSGASLPLSAKKTS